MKDTPTYSTFLELHERLQLLLTACHFTHHLVSEVFHQFIELILKHEQGPAYLFESFCELRGFELLSQLRINYRSHVLNAISMLLINLKKEQSIIYTLAQPLLTQLITETPSTHNEDQLEYYVSLLKSLAIRIDADKVSLFYNSKGINAMFPLAWQCTQFVNHRESILQTSCLNVLLKLMNIRTEEVNRYFSSFPFLTFYVNFICKIREGLLELTGHKSPVMLLHDHRDSIMTLVDMINASTDKAKSIIHRCCIRYLINPLLTNLIESTSICLTQLYLFVVNQYLILFQEQQPLIEYMIINLTHPTINDDVIKWLTDNILPPYYSRQYMPENYWTNNYPAQIKHFFRKARSIQLQQKQIQLSPDFLKEVEQIQQALRMNIVSNNNQDEGFVDMNGYLTIISKGTDQNPLIKQILSLAQSQENASMEITANVMMNILSSKVVSNRILDECRLRLSTNLNYPPAQSLIRQIMSIYMTKMSGCGNLSRTIYSLIELKHQQLLPFSEDILKNATKEVSVKMKKVIQGQKNHLIVLGVDEALSCSLKFQPISPADITKQTIAIQSHEEHLKQLAFNFTFLAERLSIHQSTKQQTRIRSVREIYSTANLSADKQLITLALDVQNPLIQARDVSTNKRTSITFKIMHFSIATLHGTKVESEKTIKYKHLKWRVSPQMTLTMLNQSEQVCELQFDSHNKLTNVAKRLHQLREGCLKAELTMLMNFANSTYKQLSIIE